MKRINKVYTLVMAGLVTTVLVLVDITQFSGAGRSKLIDAGEGVRKILFQTKKKDDVKEVLEKVNIIDQKVDKILLNMEDRNDYVYGDVPEIRDSFDLPTYNNDPSDYIRDYDEYNDKFPTNILPLEFNETNSVPVKKIFKNISIEGKIIPISEFSDKNNQDDSLYSPYIETPTNNSNKYNNMFFDNIEQEKNTSDYLAKLENEIKFPELQNKEKKDSFGISVSESPKDLKDDDGTIKVTMHYKKNGDLISYDDYMNGSKDSVAVSDVFRVKDVSKALDVKNNDENSLNPYSLEHKVVFNDKKPKISEKITKDLNQEAKKIKSEKNTKDSKNQEIKKTKSEKIIKDSKNQEIKKTKSEIITKDLNQETKTTKSEINKKIKSENKISRKSKHNSIKEKKDLPVVPEKQVGVENNKQSKEVEEMSFKLFEMLEKLNNTIENNKKTAAEDSLKTSKSSSFDLPKPSELSKTDKKSNYQRINIETEKKTGKNKFDFDVSKQKKHIPKIDKKITSTTDSKKTITAFSDKEPISKFFDKTNTNEFKF